MYRVLQLIFIVTHLKFNGEEPKKNAATSISRITGASKRCLQPCIDVSDHGDNFIDVVT